MKTKIVARTGNYSLIHHRYYGPFGEQKESFEIQWIDQDGPLKGTLNSVHLGAPLRFRKNTLLFPPLQPYTKKEYLNILKNEIINLNLPNNIELKVTPKL